MWEIVGNDHLSVGIKFPNGQQQKPMKAENLFWLRTGLNFNFTKDDNELGLPQNIQLLQSFGIFYIRRMIVDSILIVFGQM